MFSFIHEATIKNLFCVLHIYHFWMSEVLLSVITQKDFLVNPLHLPRNKNIVLEKEFFCYHNINCILEWN